MINGIKTAAASLVLALGLMLGGVERAEAIEKCDVMAAAVRSAEAKANEFGDAILRLRQASSDLKEEIKGIEAELKAANKPEAEARRALEQAERELGNLKGQPGFSKSRMDVKVAEEKVAELRQKYEAVRNANYWKVEALRLSYNGREADFMKLQSLIEHLTDAANSWSDFMSRGLRNSLNWADPASFVRQCSVLGDLILEIEKDYHDPVLGVPQNLSPKLDSLNYWKNRLSEPQPLASFWKKLFVSGSGKLGAREAALNFSSAFDSALNKKLGTVAVAAFTAFGIFNDWFVTPAQAGEALLDMPAPPSIPGSDGGGSGDAGGSKSDLDLGEAYGCLCQQPEPPLAPATPTPLSPVARGTATPEPKGK